MKNFKNQELILTVILVLVALFSFFVIAESGIIKTWNTETIMALDEKKQGVTNMSLLAVATSSAVTLIPGDTATPLANQLMDITDYLLVVLASVWLQKYLVNVTAVLAFKVLIPLSCLLYIGNIYYKTAFFKRLATKLLLFGFLFVTIIPASVSLSQHIEETFEVSQVQVEGKNENLESQDQEIKETENDNIWDKISGTISNSIDSVQETATSKIEEFQNTFSQLVDRTAVLIVTTCVIPVLVFAFFFWISNFILGTNLSIPSITKLSLRKNIPSN